MVSNLSNEVAEMRGRVDSQHGRAAPKNLSDYTEEDLTQVATKDEHWESSPGAATQALLALMDKKQEKTAASLREEILGTIQDKSMTDSNYSKVQERITNEFGIVKSGTNHYEAALDRLRQQAEKYDKKRDLPEFIRKHPEYLYWAVKEAAEDLGIKRGQPRGSSSIAQGRSLPAPEDRLEGSSEVAMDDLAAEQESLEKLTHDGNYKDAISILTKRMMRGAPR